MIRFEVKYRVFAKDCPECLAGEADMMAVSKYVLAPVS